MAQVLELEKQLKVTWNECKAFSKFMSWILWVEGRCNPNISILFITVFARFNKVFILSIF